jgi:hypothetical protein
MKTDNPYVFVCITILYGMIILAATGVLVTALLRVRTDYGATLRNIFSQTRFLELTTVLAIIVSGTFLALAGALSEGIVALLSGIGGYVLGGLRRSTGKKNESKSTAPQR